MLAGDTTTSGSPVPDSATFCAPVPALSWSVSVALLAPSALGVNPTAIVHLPLGASPPTGQVETPGAKSPALAPLTLTLPMNKSAFPAFFTSRFLDTVLPSVDLPTFSFAGTDIAVVGVGIGMAVAVPVAVAVMVAVGVGPVAVGVGVL